MNNIEQENRISNLREKIIRLGPWHLDVQVTPEISTRVFLEAPAGTYPSSFGDVSFISAREGFQEQLLKIYPQGLGGRTVLDCACNCGGYLFWAKELGAGECFGFDVRRHWIDQACFLKANRPWPSDRMRFEVRDLYDLPELVLQPFDITLFNGIFYHLPEPVGGLKIVADLTKELISIDIATRSGLPDGMLAISEEDNVAVMSGVYGLNWLPTGPNVISRILKWMGFTETRCVYWVTGTEDEPLGRLQVIASRNKGLLEQFEPSGS